MTTTPKRAGRGESLIQGLIMLAVAGMAGAASFTHVHDWTMHNSPPGTGEGSIFPYRNGYAAYVWVNKPDGKRGRKYVYGQTREIVHDKWIKLQTQAGAGPVATKTQTLGEFVSYWLREIVEPNLAPGSYVTYEVIARCYLIPGLGKRRLDRLTTRDVQTWINELGRTCQCCAQGKDERRKPVKRRCCALGRCCQDTPSSATVAHVRRVLRTVLTQAMTDQFVTQNVGAW